MAARNTGHTVLERALLAGTHRDDLLIGYFYAMIKLPLATAVTLNYTSPIWLALLSTLLLGERFRPRLVLAIVVGFAGIALLLRPTMSAENAHAGLIGLASGFFAACAYVNVKKLVTPANRSGAWSFIFRWSARSGRR